MTFRPWVVAALCLGSLAAWTSATPPGSRRYKLEVKTKILQDLTVMGQGPQTQEYSNAGFVTLTARDSANGQAVVVVLDSLQTGAGSPLTPEQVKSAAGSTWHGFRGPNGRVADLVLTGENPVAQTVEGLLSLLFPPLRAGTTPGQAWVDTTDAEALLGVTARTITTFAASTDTYQSTRVTRLEGKALSSISGTVQSPQGQVVIEGTGTGALSWLVGADGVLLLGNGTSAQSMTVSIAVAPAPIPVTIDVQTSTTLIQ